MIERSYEHPTISHRWEDNANVTLWGWGGAIGRAERRTRTARMMVYSARSGAPGDEMLISVVDTFGEAEAAFERYIEQRAR